MLSASFDINEFIDKVKGRSDHEIIYMADREATEAERHCYKRSNGENAEDARSYATLLKDVVLYMRHGIQTHAVRQIDLLRLDVSGWHC
jgi:hypothetical protein